jgi:uncharacterized membrane protein YhaH (DUF805 family)
MFAILRFAGRIKRLPYAALSLPVFFVPHAFDALVLASRGQTLVPTPAFLLEPVRALVWYQPLTLPLTLWCFAVSLASAYLLVALAFCRARDANLSGWVAAPAIVPVLQIPAILFLCLMPSSKNEITQSYPSSSRLDWLSALQGIVAGMALTLCAVAAGTLAFGTYGYGLFFVSPFLIGAVTAYLSNRNGDIGFNKTASVVAAAAIFGAFSLLAVALEGLICIFVAAPLAVLAAMIGGIFGRSAALVTRRSTSQSLMSIALLPLVFTSERMLPPSVQFETQEAIDIEAKPSTVWHAIVDMAPLKEQPTLPFRLGVAYPVAARMKGEGVGATRIGVFSTGVAVERVTQWVPDHLFAFSVISNPPAMHELSPYRTVNAPHLHGYFVTNFTSFQLEELPNGYTRVVERTRHELKLGPVLYWLPLARWIVHENNIRVLAHIRSQAMTTDDWHFESRRYSVFSADYGASAA